MVEKFNHTLLDMIAKHAAYYGPDWDKYLCYLLFAYRVKPHYSTGESPFYLLYGRDVRLPTELQFNEKLTSGPINPDEYKTELVKELSDAVAQAQANIANAQSSYKWQYDKKTTKKCYTVGDRVFVYSTVHIE